MKPFARYILSKTLKPFLELYYLRTERTWQFDGLDLHILPGIFHPGLFYSSKFLAQFLAGHDLAGKKVLDVGCGSGLLSLVAAKAGADVTSIDINALAVINTRENATQNKIRLLAMQSDLFLSVTGDFSYILINPPYYPKTPQTNSDHAWYCGEKHHYFKRLFKDIGQYTELDAVILMVLSDTCELDEIKRIAEENGFKMVVRAEKSTILERLYVFECATLSM